MSRSGLPSKAFSYIRFSSPEQAKGDSFRRQLEMAEAYAARHNLELDLELTFEDLGTSAFRSNNARSGQLAAFRRAVEDGVVPQGSYLLVESLDRISRDNLLEAFDTLRSIMRLGVIVVTLGDQRQHTEEMYRGESGFSEWILTLATMFRANEESRTKGRRVRAAWDAKRAKAMRGDYRLTKKGPSWLEPIDGKSGWRVVRSKANIVRRIFRMSAAGAGQHHIAQTLNREGVPTLGKATQWHVSTVRKLLGSEAVVGVCVPHTIEHQDNRRVRKPGERIEDYYPRIVDPQTWDAVQGRTAAGQSRGRHAQNGPRHLLANLARCPTCGSTMTRVVKGPASQAKLVCTRAKTGAGCDYVSVSLSNIETALVANASALANDDSLLVSDAVSEKELSALEAAESGILDQIEALLDVEARGGSTPELVRKRRELESERDRLRVNHAKLIADFVASTPHAVHARLKRVSEAFELLARNRGDLSALKEANEALKAALKAVIVDHTTGHVILDWRHGPRSRLLYTMRARTTRKGSGRVRNQR